jgi:hypothetical protein
MTSLPHLILPTVAAARHVSTTNKSTYASRSLPEAAMKPVVFARLIASK